MPYTQGKDGGHSGDLASARAETGTRPETGPQAESESGLSPVQRRGAGRMPIVLALLAAILVLCLLFPGGDQVADLEFDAEGSVLSILEDEGGRVAGLWFQPEGEEAPYMVALSPRCRVVGAGGKVSAHQLPGKRVRLHFAPSAGLPLATGEYTASKDLDADRRDILIMADVIFVESM